jgi:DNA polymerase-1
MIAIIDAEYLIYHAAWQSRDMPMAAPTILRGLLKDLLTYILDNRVADHVLLCSSEGSALLHKKEKYPVYKAKRKDAPEIAEVKTMLREALNEHCCTAARYEADDVIAAMQRKWGEQKTIIVSPDKDLKNIPGAHLNPKTKEVTIIDEEIASHNFWTQMITGDSSDNIPGIPGVGPAGAKKILHGCITDEERCQAVRKAYQNRGGDYAMNLFLLSFYDVPEEFLNPLIPQPIAAILSTL